MQLHASAMGLGVVTGQQLIAAPGTGLRITVLGFVVSVGSTAAAVSLVDSVNSANTKAWQLAANDHVESGLCRWELSPNAALQVTTSANGPTDVEIDYVIESVV